MQIKISLPMNISGCSPVRSAGQFDLKFTFPIKLHFGSNWICNLMGNILFPALFPLKGRHCLKQALGPPVGLSLRQSYCFASIPNFGGHRHAFQMVQLEKFYYRGQWGKANNTTDLIQNPAKRQPWRKLSPTGGSIANLKQYHAFGDITVKIALQGFCTIEHIFPGNYFNAALCGSRMSSIYGI